MKKLTVCVFGTLTGLAISEILVANFLPQPPLAEPGLNRGAFTKPGVYPHTSDEFSVQVKVNSHGFVDNEWGDKTKPRTLLIGDSFVQGAQVELNEGLGRRLQKLMPNDEIISIGVPGAGTTTAFELAKKYVVELEADTVVLCFLPSNDIMNNHYALDGKPDKPYRQLKNNDLMPLKKSLAHHPPLLGKSQLFRYFIRRFQERSYVSSQVRNREYPKMFDVQSDHIDTDWEQAWTITEIILEEFSIWATESNIRFGIAIIPSQYEVSPSHWLNQQKQWPELEHLSTGFAYTRSLEMSAKYAPTLDLYPSFKVEPDANYYPADGHWTPRGHDLAAKLMKPFINEINTPIQEMVK